MKTNLVRGSYIATLTDGDHRTGSLVLIYDSDAFDKFKEYFTSTLHNNREEILWFCYAWGSGPIVKLSGEKYRELFQS